MNESQTLDHTQIIMWPTPTGISASSDVTHATRVNHYLTTSKAQLANGVNVVPNSETLELIFQAWDNFNAPVVISSDSYIVKD